MQQVTDCLIHHTEESVNDSTYTVCFECGHAWTASDLMDAHNAIVDDLVDQTDWADAITALESRVKTPEAVLVCPACSHDF